MVEADLPYKYIEGRQAGPPREAKWLLEHTSRLFKHLEK